MELERFCDKYCPVPERFVNLADPNDVYSDCDLNIETECPFRFVVFGSVIEREASK